MATLGLSFLPFFLRGLRRYGPLTPLLIVLGCFGTVSIDLKTTVHGEQRLRHEIEMVTAGPSGESFRADFDIAQLEAEGWEVSVKEDEDEESVTLTMSRDFTGDFSTLTSHSPTFEAVGVQIEETELGTEYRVSMTGRDGGQFYDPKEFEDMDEPDAQILAEAFKIRWIVEVPGEITDTNADAQNVNTAAWDKDLRELSAIPELYVVSLQKKSEEKLPSVGETLIQPLMLGLLLAGIALLPTGLMFIKRRSRS